MIGIKDTSVFNLDGALRGIRNPMSSWKLSDSAYGIDGEYVLGERDLDLATRLCRAGSDHRKFIRQVMVCADITAPLYWWKEFDTYKVGTTANSTSTMHKIHSKPITESEFSVEKLSSESLGVFKGLIGYMESLRVKYNETGDKSIWYEMIQILPSSYNQLRTVTLNYEVLHNMYYARKGHKLDEWISLCLWIEGLSYAKPLIIGD
jgi:hypothetical protein